MQNELREFLVLRYSLVEASQGALVHEPIPQPKGRAVLAALQNDREFRSRGSLFSFVGFTEPSVLRTKLRFERYFVGKLARLKSARVGKKVPGDIIEQREDDWIGAMLVIDIDSQHIFVEKNWKFGQAERFISIIQEGLRKPILERYNLRIFVEARTSKEHFWKVLRAHRRLYNLELKLVAPNILETNRSARAALESMRELFANDEAILKLKSESGNLKIPENPVRDYLEYIEEGEGAWALTTEGAEGKGKKRHKSSDRVSTVELPVSDPHNSKPHQLELSESESVFERITREATLLVAVDDHLRKLNER